MKLLATLLRNRAVQVLLAAVLGAAAMKLGAPQAVVSGLQQVVPVALDAEAAQLDPERAPGD